MAAAKDLHEWIRRQKGLKMFNLKTPLRLVVLALALTTTMLAAVTHTGTTIAKITVVTEINFWPITSTSFTDVPGAVATITVPAGVKQLVVASFTSESSCIGSSNAQCHLRIVAVNSSNVLVELSPAAGLDFAYDSSATQQDFFEGHAANRSIVLGPGTYKIKIQGAAGVSGVTFRFDDWHLQVIQYNGGV